MPRAAACAAHPGVGSAARWLCPSCGTENLEGKKFCKRVRDGACHGDELRLLRRCSRRGREVLRGVRRASRGDSTPAPPVTPVREARGRAAAGLGAVRRPRRLHPLSEDRDAEATRELLSGYFELARRLIGRYGGTVEKFIGDAVMAVWGTPTATEDDAERAVRAALDLVASVPELAAVGAIQARAGVLTGEAAVTIGAQGEGMVAGDLVNTASRIQSVGRARDGARRRGDAAGHRAGDRLRGGRLPRAQGEVRAGAALPCAPCRLGRARHAQVGRPRGAVRRPRPRAAADQGPLPRLRRGPHAHLVSVTGIAGIGKSRLAWEFYKYFDGIVEPIWWHRGRCLAYGEGVAYWALADMVRMRCRIGEDERTEPAREKLRSTLAEHILDEDERAFVEPRLAHLLGLEEHGRPSARISSRPGGSSSSGWPTRTPTSSRSRTCSGPTRASSTSSSTCWSGRATTRCT